jgi:hypothetical protein
MTGPNKTLQLTGPAFGFPRFNVNPAGPAAELGRSAAEMWTTNL